MDRRVFIQGLVATSTALAAGEVGAKPATGDASAGAPGPNAEPPRAASEPAGAPAARRAGPGEPASAENLWPLLAPLAPGDAIGLGWSVVELSVVSAGVATLTLARGAETERVQLCRLEGAARGVAHSDRLDLVLMDRTGGMLPTDESLARVLNVLGLLIRSHERAGAATPDGLVCHDSFAFFRARQALL